jgi:hypothetical protein
MCITFDQEGEYRLEMEDEAGKTYTANFTIRQTAPICTITETETGVRISYDPDVVESLVLVNGKRQTTYSELTEVTKPGNYTLYLYDASGNVGTYSFHVKRQINVATIAAILMVIGIIAAGVIFYRRTQKDINLK